MKFIFSIIIILFSMMASASMAPRMYSIMAQISGTIQQSTDFNGDPTYSNKLSIEALYLVRSGPTFGGRYLIESRSDNESTGGQAYGPMAGYYSERGLFFLVTYDVFAKLGRWTNGEGFQVDLGYIQHIGEQLHVGGKYSYRSMRYKTDISDNTAEKKDVLENFPSVVVTYLF